MSDWQVITGDCLEVMPTLEANSVDTIITDPPYGIFFMSRDWDHGIPGPRFWIEALRVAKPGAMLLAFGGSRTFHRLAVAIEDAGWEIRDTIMWIYGSGFPKSHDISKAIDKAAGAERDIVGKKTRPNGKEYGRPTGYGQLGCNTMRPDELENSLAEGIERTQTGQSIKSEIARLRRVQELGLHDTITAPATPAAQEWSGYGTALKPAHEPIIVAMKPLDGTFAENAQRWGVAGMWIDGGRVETDSDDVRSGGFGLGKRPWQNGGNGETVKVDGTTGRWPANVITDGSAEVLAGFPVTTSGKPGIMRLGKNSGAAYGAESRPPGTPMAGIGDTGSAARFFYTAKASRSERNAGLEGLEARHIRRHSGGEYAHNSGSTNSSKNGAHSQNHHPTVKPLALMRYLARLTQTPTGGVVLDPFAGSGSTGCAAVLEGRSFIGIEQDAEYADIARRRIAHWQEQGAQLELL